MKLPAEALQCGLQRERGREEERERKRKTEREGGGWGGQQNEPHA